MPEHIVKACPRCGKLLEIKTNRETKQEFLGCTGWRAAWEGCQYTEPLPEALKMRRQGQRDMFDLEGEST